MPDIGLFNPNAYSESIKLFLHLLGAIYFFAFGAQLFQIRGLIGKEGILPIENYLNYLSRRLQKKKFYYVPTVFWLNHSDTMLWVVPACGALLGLFLLVGGPPALLIPCLIILHLSIISIGQDFWGFGWEGFLLEISYNAFFLSLTDQPNLLVWISINLLLFRFHFEAGTSKIESGDPNWRNLTALKFHYQSQPLPNTIAWYIYKLPLGFHKFSTFKMFFIELVIPFFALFGTPEMRLGSFVLFFGLQFFIWFTGNFSYLNYLTVVLSVILIANTYLELFFGAPPMLQPTHWILDNFLSLAGLGLIFLQIIALWNHYSPTITTRKILRYIYHLHIANRYGIFAIMTTDRYEIIIEGSDDETEWKEYYFWHKPSELTRRPRRISPYQPRIDWQAWFLPFGAFEEQDWFKSLLICLLKGSPSVLSLLRHNPFPEKPPQFIRAQIYLYEFSDQKTKKKLGFWWTRQYLGPYSPTYKLNKQ
jgi:lipase maturation factor 1